MSRGILVNDLELGCIKGMGREEVEGEGRRRERGWKDKEDKRGAVKRREGR